MQITFTLVVDIADDGTLEKLFDDLPEQLVTGIDDHWPTTFEVQDVHDETVCIAAFLKSCVVKAVSL